MLELLIRTSRFQFPEDPRISRAAIPDVRAMKSDLEMVHMLEDVFFDI